jgi:hypothetical protein
MHIDADEHDARISVFIRSTPRAWRPVGLSEERQAAG